MANFLTPDQYQQTQAAKKPGATYSSYKTWVQKTRAKRAAVRNQGGTVAAPSYDPTGALLTPAQMQVQARQMVQPQYQAALSAIVDSITRTSKLGKNAITGYTGNYLSQLPGIQSQISDIYSGAKNEQSQLNAGLAQLMQTQNATATNSQAAAAAAAGGNNTGANQIAATGLGALGATAAYGGSTSERLIGQGAADQAYAAKLPAWGAALGQQTLGNFLAGQQGAQNQQTSDLNAQLPGMVSSAYQTLVSQEQNKASLAEQHAQNVLQAQQAAAAAAESQREFNIQQAQSAASAREQARQFNASLAQQKAEAAARAKAAGTKNPTTPIEWGNKLGENAGAYQSILEKARYPRGLSPLDGKPNGGRIAKWGVVRQKLTAAVRTQYPGAPPGVVKSFVDNLMRVNGWDPTAAPTKKPKGKGSAGGGLQGPAGSPSGPTGPVGNSFSLGPNIGFPPVTNPLTDLQQSASSFWNYGVGDVPGTAKNIWGDLSKWPWQ